MYMTSSPQTGDKFYKVQRKVAEQGKVDRSVQRRRNLAKAAQCYTHPDGKRSAFGEINSHHMWGLSAALRNESLEGINFREIRVGMEVNRPLPVRETDPRMRPLSEDVGALCAGLAENAEGKEDSGSLLTISDQDKLAQLLEDYSCK